MMTKRYWLQMGFSLTIGLISFNGLLLGGCSVVSDTTITAASVAGSAQPHNDLELPAASTKAHKLQLTRRSNWTLSEKASLLVLPLSNPLLQAEFGFRIQKSLQAALEERFAAVDIRVGSGRDRARLTPEWQYHYLVEPQLLVFQERRNSLLEVLNPGEIGPLGRDRVIVKLSLYDAQSKKLLDTTLVEVSSRRLALREWRPDMLIHAAFSNYARELSAL